MNDVKFDGFLGGDPKIEETEIGQVATFQIANHDRKSDYPIWIPCVAFGKKVELIKATLNKGDRIVITGRIRMREVPSRYLEIEVLYLWKCEKGQKQAEFNTESTTMGNAFNKAIIKKDEEIDESEKTTENTKKENKVKDTTNNKDKKDKKKK